MSKWEEFEALTTFISALDHFMAKHPQNFVKIYSGRSNSNADDGARSVFHNQTLEYLLPQLRNEENNFMETTNLYVRPDFFKLATRKHGEIFKRREEKKKEEIINAMEECLSKLSEWLAVARAGEEDYRFGNYLKEERPRLHDWVSMEVDEPSPTPIRGEITEMIQEFNIMFTVIGDGIKEFKFSADDLNSLLKTIYGEIEEIFTAPLLPDHMDDPCIFSPKNKEIILNNLMDFLKSLSSGAAPSPVVAEASQGPDAGDFGGGKMRRKKRSRGSRNSRKSSRRARGRVGRKKKRNRTKKRKVRSKTYKRTNRRRTLRR